MGIYNAIDKYLLIPSADMLFGSTLSTQLRRLKADEFISQEKIQEIQNEKLRLLVRHCYETVPYYHRLFNEYGIRPEEIRNKEDLQRIPILTKQIIRPFLYNRRSQSTQVCFYGRQHRNPAQVLYG